MGWADYAVKDLQAGKTVQIRPRGNSMVGLINSGQLVTIDPIVNRILIKDDIVLVKVRGNIYLHLIKAVNRNRYLIGNNRGGINGWVNANSIYGIAVKVE